jgi:hypothetical protein
MTKYYPGTQITYGTTVTNNGVLATPATIAFQYKESSWGGWTSVTPNLISTGVYTANVTPTLGGALFWQWKTTGPAVVQEGMTYIEPSAFSSNGFYGYDYGFGPYFWGW